MSALAPRVTVVWICVCVVVSFLLARGVEVSDYDSRHLVMCLAAQNRGFAILLHLHRAGWACSGRNEGEMLLLKATENNDLPMLEYMLLHMYLRPGPFVPTEKRELTTLLHVACRQASVRVVALLAAFSDKNDE